jgi:hypothetical protein
MTALLDSLDELDRLVRTARTRALQSTEQFISGLHDAMQNVQALLVGRPNHDDFLDADSILTEAIAAYEKHPTQRGVGTIGNALVRYRGTATS